LKRISRKRKLGQKSDLAESLLDATGLVALWREGLLAQKVLLGRTKAYRVHPQLDRFRACNDPVAAISTYLWGVIEEAEARGYAFDSSKIVLELSPISLFVTQGQLEFEWKHLRRKLSVRDPARHRSLTVAELRSHPMLRVIAGGIEPWEVV